MEESSLQFSKVISSEKFYKDIEQLVKDHKLKYMDAIIYFCERNEVEIETVASMIRGNMRIKAILQVEGELLNFLPKTAKLPI
jgi:hypothetical protein